MCASLSVDKTAPASIGEGNPIAYTFAITNTSPASTDPVTVTSVMDNVLGDLTTAANAAWISQGHTGAIVLAPGQIFTFTFTTPTPPNAGTVFNLVTVSGRDDEGTVAVGTDTATVTVTDRAPSLTVNKTAPAGISEGNVVTYNFAITNTSPASTDPVTVTSVVDNVLGDLTSAANAAWIAQGHTGPIVLAQNEVFAFSFTTPAPLDAGTVVNLVTVSGQDDEGNTATATDTATVLVTNVIPSITVEKSAPASVPEGNTITYSYTITNVSAASTDPVTVTSVVDNVLGNLTAAANAAWLAQGNTGPIVLQKSESFTFTFTTLAPENAGSVVNTVGVVANDNEGSTTTAVDTATVEVTNVTPSITIDKTAPASVVEGNTITYTFAITNTSLASTDPVTVTSVIDDVLGDLTAAAIAANGGNPIVLAPGDLVQLHLHDDRPRFRYGDQPCNRRRAGR